jgi:ABC-2 type transport system permease protein
VAEVSSWRQLWGFFQYDLIETLRLWPISLFSVALTAFYYVMLLAPMPAGDRAGLTVAFVILAVIGMAMFQFSAKVSYERLSPWNAFMRTLPVSIWVRFGSRFLIVLLMGSCASAVLVTVGAVRFGLAVFAPIGACIGGTLDPRLTPAVVTIIYLGAAWSSGVWTSGHTPRFLDQIGFLLPLPAIRKLALAVTDGDWLAAFAAMVVTGIWTLGALMIARLVYRREETRAFT